MGKRLKRKLKRTGAPLCAYCGTRPGTTNDHVVPRCLFPDPKPPDSRMIIVPACPECNNRELARNQDYLRDALVNEIGCHLHLAAASLAEGPLTRSAQRNQSDIVKAIKSKGFGYELFYSEDTVYVGAEVRLPVEQERLDKVLKTMAKGLYYDKFKERVPDDYLLEVGYHDRRDPDWLNNLTNAFLEFGVRRIYHLGERIFDCLLSYVDLPDGQRVTGWLMLFYGSYGVVLMMKPPNLDSLSGVDVENAG